MAMDADRVAQNIVDEMVDEDLIKPTDDNYIDQVIGTKKMMKIIAQAMIDEIEDYG